MPERGRRRRFQLLSLAAASVALALPAAAHAGEPIMPLSQVRAGMRCTGLSVFKGTAISSFDVDVLDVVDEGGGPDGIRILVRVSGPAVDQTGIGPGFSGSPIYCPDDAGNQRNAGAISESVGEYGNKVALATPIELVLGESADPPAGTRRATAAERAARPISAPLSVGGLSPQLARVLAVAARRARRAVLAVPARPRAAFAPRTLVPGSAMAAGLASGDVTLGAVGTVAYTDGDRVWAFGHPLDGTGRRSLLLQDAYVFSVIDNPLGFGDATTYKLAAAGNDVGMLVNDAPNAIVGRVGKLPATVPLRIVAHDLDTGALRVTSASVADEADVGLPSGASPLSVVGPLALAQASTAILRGAPARQSGSMCLRVEVRGRRAPMRFCNTYVGGGAVPGAADEDAGSFAGIVGAQMVTDVSEAVTLLDGFSLGDLHVTKLEANVKLRRGLRQAVMLDASAPAIVRRGRRIAVRVRIRRVRGAKRTLTLRVRVPRNLGRGERLLVITGTPADSVESGLAGALAQSLDVGTPTGPGGDATDVGPRTVAELADAIAAIHRFDGVRASFRIPGRESGDGGGAPPDPGRPVYRDPDLRISGVVAVPVLVVG